MFLAVEFNRQVFGVTADGKGGVERARGIDEETGAGEIAVLVGPADLYDGFRRLLENVFDFAADGSRGRLLRADQSGEGKKNEREREPGHRRKERPEKLWRPTKI